MRYKLNTQSASITRLADGASIPLDADNTDYAAYLDWLAEGNVPEPADPIPEPSAQSKIEALERGDMIPRVVREFMLVSIRENALKANKDPMLLPAYAKLKARDEEIIALRAKL